ISPGVRLNNWLEVGASAAQAEKLAAGFSNYCKQSVDLFAPGDDILSTIPDNQYKKLKGTSMAAPVVSGIAALALSQYPELDILTLKQYLLNTVRAYPNLQVVKPGTDDEKINFSDLSSTGGVVDAYAFIQALSSDLNSASNNHCETKINDIYSGYLDDPRALENCIAITNISSQQNNKYYYVFVPAGTKTLKLSLTDGEGNADLYVSEAVNGWPSATENDFSSTEEHSTDLIEINNPTSDQFYHIMIAPASTYSNVSLKAELIN
ncbi:S8 family serine peptidase, partial [Endozoicomonas sp. SM1973]